jgi:ornithine cyclodeaminase/alanine dehydrogenase-like protein (mu-crystallin family)
VLILDEEKVREFLRYEELIPEVERALRDLSTGKLLQPVRHIQPVHDHHGFFATMPAVDGDLMGAKLVTIYEGNAGLGLPTHQAVIMIFRAATGEPLAVMDGRLITEMRTAAVSAAAVRLLAKPDAKVLAILGSGVQAASHLRALRMVRGFEEVRVWSRTPEHARRFADEFGVKAVAIEEAVSGADVVITVTSAHEPLLRGAWLKPDAFACAVGAVGPKRRELDDDVLRDALVVVESREAAVLESGDILSSGAAIYAEIGELIAGVKALPPVGKCVVFKSLGVAAEDLAAARLVYEKAAGRFDGESEGTLRPVFT